jgi:predicted transcriptional regulator
VSSRQVVVEQADLSRLERLIERLIEESRRHSEKILEELERNRSEIRKSRLEILTSFLGSELARVRARKASLEQQLAYLNRKFQEVTEIYYTRFKAVLIDYLKSIRDYSRQFLEMAEPEFSSLRKVKAQVEFAEEFSQELERRYSWINEELVSALVNVDLEARINDMKRLVESLEKLQEQLVAQSRSYRDLQGKIEKYSFPRDIARHGTVLYLPIVAVRCEVGGEKAIHYLGPSVDAPIVKSILSRPPALDDKYRLPPSEVDVDKLRKKLATLAADPQERSLLESVEIEVV